MGQKSEVADTQTRMQSLFALASKSVPPEHLGILCNRRFVSEQVSFEAMNERYAMGYDWKNKMLREAASIGDLITMTLAMDWGATDYADALSNAAAGGHIRAMELAKRRGATNYNSALAFAAKTGKIEAMVCAKKFGATDYAWALMWAVCGGNIEEMELVNKWATMPQKCMFPKAVKDKYKWALEFGWKRAVEDEQIEAAALLKRWSDEEAGAGM